MTHGQSSNLAVDVHSDADAVVLTVTGDLDMSSVDMLLGPATGMLADGARRLVLDFAGVSFCDSAGVNGLIRIRNECDRLSCEFQLVKPQHHVRRVLVDLMGLGDLLNVAPEEPDR